MSRPSRAAGRQAYVVAAHAVQRNNAPAEPEHERPPAPRTVITQAMIDEWLANDEELASWREQEARPPLW